MSSKSSRLAPISRTEERFHDLALQTSASTIIRHSNSYLTIQALIPCLHAYVENRPRDLLQYVEHLPRQDAISLCRIVQ